MRKECCIHFRGFQHDTCSAGIAWKSVTPEPLEPGSALRAPCHKKCLFSNPSAAQLASIQNKGTCPHYQEPTTEELAEYDREIGAETARMTKAFTIISELKREHKGHSWQGVKLCPVCAGKLHLSHSGYNGHVHGRCETEGCLNWME